MRSVRWRVRVRIPGGERLLSFFFFFSRHKYVELLQTRSHLKGALRFLVFQRNSRQSIVKRTCSWLTLHIISNVQYSIIPWGYSPTKVTSLLKRRWFSELRVLLSASELRVKAPSSKSSFQASIQRLKKRFRISCLIFWQFSDPAVSRVLITLVPLQTTQLRRALRSNETKASTTLAKRNYHPSVSDDPANSVFTTPLEETIHSCRSS